MEKVDRTQADQDKEIVQLGKELKAFSTELKLKLDKNDAKLIWQHFKRFAYYEDLKDLNSKFLPELAKFEQRLMDIKCDYDKICIMIRLADETLAAKSNKSQIVVLHAKIDETCALKTEQKAFMDKMELINEIHKAKFTEQR